MYDAPPAEDWRYFEDDLLTRGVISRRVFSWLIDGLLLALLCGIAWVMLLIFGLLTLGLGLPLLGLVPFIPGLYTFLFVAGPHSATPGEYLMGITVRREDDLGRPTALQALVWTVGYYLTFVAGVIWLAVALVTTRRRTLHDMASGLIVVHRRALTRPAPFWNIPGGSPAR